MGNGIQQRSQARHKTGDVVVGGHTLGQHGGRCSSAFVLLYCQ